MSMVACLQTPQPHLSSFAERRTCFTQNSRECKHVDIPHQNAQRAERLRPALWKSALYEPNGVMKHRKGFG